MKKRIFLSELKEPKVKCNDCNKIIKGHIFKKYNVPLCADCYVKRNEKTFKSYWS